MKNKKKLFIKYIDSYKLTTIIEDRKAKQDKWINRYHDPINQGISQELIEILSIITSLQQEQPEVDLEKEVRMWKNKYGVVGMDDLWLNFARYIYELGINARKK